MNVKPFRESDFFSFIADYIGDDGQYHNQVFQVERVPGRTAHVAACRVCEILREQGYKPITVCWVKGRYSMEQLVRIAGTGKGPPPEKVVGWIVDEGLMRESVWDEIRSGRLNIFDHI